MKNQNWSISSKDHVNYDDEEEQTVAAAEVEEEEEEEEEEQTLKPTNPYQSARQGMIERKMQVPDARGQLFR